MNLFETSTNWIPCLLSSLMLNTSKNHDEQDYYKSMLSNDDNDHVVGGDDYADDHVDGNDDVGGDHVGDGHLTLATHTRVSLC